MLKIHKLHSKSKLFIISITSILSIGVLLGFYGLIYTPELSYAETVTHKKALADITYMQDINVDICKNTAEADNMGNNQHQLIDKRDGKTYWVAKLKDGNCWMTQNLDLDLSTNRKLTSDDSDVRSWTPNSNTKVTDSPNFTATINIVESWDPAMGGAPTYCNDGGVAGKCKLSGNSTASINNGHDAQGNYYSWAAATAGQASGLTSTSSQQSTQSICPKGWTLPQDQASTAGTLVVRSYRNLFDNYGWIWNAGADPTKRSDSITSVVGNLTYNVTGSPFYFVYAGAVSGISLSGNIGASGYYWSSTSSNANYAYNLRMDTSVEPSSTSPRYLGLSVRCVARTESIPDNNIEITVNNTVSLDVVSEVEIEKTETNPSTANFDVKVASNQGYKVQINSTSPTLTSSTTSTTIPSRAGALNTNVNGWGVKLSTVSTYTQITSTLKIFYTASGAEIKTIPFTVGISTTPDLPNGEYSTDITVTATQN